MTTEETIALRVDEHLVMRTLTPDDAAEVLPVVDRNRAYLRPWIPWVDRVNTVDEARAFLQHYADKFAAGNDVVFGMFHDGRYLGNIGLHDFNRGSNSIMAGYWIAEDAQRRGTVTACMKPLLAYAFETRQVNRVWMYCDVRNIRSGALAVRTGFRHEGTCRDFFFFDGAFRDAHIYAILRRDWDMS